jgi:cytochrome c551/c552
LSAGLDNFLPQVSSIERHVSCEVVWDWTPSKSANAIRHQATLAIFALAGCPSCDALAGDLVGMAQIAQRYPSVRFLWVEGIAKSHAHPVSDGWTSALSPRSGAHAAMDIPGTPFAYLISASARVLAKGLVNRKYSEVLWNGMLRTGVVTA